MKRSGTKAMRIHRDLVIRAIETDPSRWREIVSDPRVHSAEEAVGALRAGPEWLGGSDDEATGGAS